VSSRERIPGHAGFNERLPTNYRPIKQQVSCQTAAGVSYSNQQILRNAFGWNLPSCGQSPDVGTVWPFPKSKKAKVTIFEVTGSSNLPKPTFACRS
jgi:hypothetical protein